MAKKSVETIREAAGWTTVRQLVEQLVKCHPEQRVLVSTKMMQAGSPFAELDDIADVAEAGAFVILTSKTVDRISKTPEMVAGREEILRRRAQEQA